MLLLPLFMLLLFLLWVHLGAIALVLVFDVAVGLHVGRADMVIRVEGRMHERAHDAQVDRQVHVELEVGLPCERVRAAHLEAHGLKDRPGRCVVKPGQAGHQKEKKKLKRGCGGMVLCRKKEKGLTSI